MKSSYNIKAELAVLGAALLSDEALLPIISSLNKEDFYVINNQLIFNSILEVYQEKKVVNIPLLVEYLDSNKELDAVGGIDYIDKIADQITYIKDYQNQIDIVKERSLLRQLINTCIDISKNWDEDRINVANYLSISEDRILDITRKRRYGKFTRASDLTELMKTKARMSVKELENQKGIESGFSDLDKILNGFHKDDLIILAARPSVGKTALALSLAYNAAKDGKMVGFFSMEMSALKLVERIVSSISNIPADRWKDYRFTSDIEVGKFTNALNKLSKLPFYIDDTPSLTLQDIYTKSRALENVDMIIIDYLGLIRSNKKIDRHLQIAEISQGLKALARELHIPIIVLCQLSRDVEKRSTTNRRPMMSDLRDSGSIEQDADVVMLLYREDYYKNHEINNNQAEASNIIEINVAKHRNGAIGEVKLHYFRDIQKFVSYSYKKEQ